MKTNNNLEIDTSPTQNKKKESALRFKSFRLIDLILMAYDICAVSVAYFFALWFRFDCRISEIPEYYLSIK